MPTKIALALGGGGSRGDFQVGAVQYLYEYLPRVHNILQPHILCGTSSGSILAAKLCEGEDPNAPSRGLKGLIRFWQELKFSRDMWNEESWLATVGPDAQRAFAWGVGVLGASMVYGPIGFLVSLALAASDFARLADDLERASTARSLWNIDPVKAKLSTLSGLDPALVARSGITLRMTTVALESGALRYITQDGHVLERDLLTPVYGSIGYAPECWELAETLQALQTELMGEQEELARKEPGADVSRINQLQVQVGQARAALAACELQHPRRPGELIVRLVDGIIASASIPTAFPPVKLGNENYVDGGVRDMVPIEPAVRLGATRVYAVCSCAAAVPPARSQLDGHLIANFDSSNLLDITSRVSMDLMTNEITRLKTDPPNGWGPVEVIVIEPDHDLHDIMTIDSGLIRIAMGHGYMRADDVMKAWEDDRAHYRTVADSYTGSRQTTTIIRLRRMIWEREYAANGWRFSVDNSGRPKPVVSPNDRIGRDATALADVKRMKRELKALVDQRIAAGGLCPPDVAQWWLDWERHDWTPELPLWAANEFAPLRHLQVAATPAWILRGFPVQVLVTAAEGTTSVNNAPVLVNDVQVGVTGTPFPYTFTGHNVTVIDEDTHRPRSVLVDDVITVRANRQVYYEEVVTCGFFTPTAQIISQSVPATLTVGQTAQVAITVKNITDAPWTPAAGYKLGSQSPQDNTTWGTNRVNLLDPDPVAPGAQVTFNFSVTAPATPGIYDFQWQMFLEGFGWFGPKTTLVKVDVVPAIARAAEFDSQSVSPRILPGQALPTTWKVVMKNTGTETWTAAAGYALGSQSPQDNTNWTKNRIPLPNAVAPGQAVTFKFTGCSAPTVEGLYTFQWRMLKEGVEWFGPMTTARSVAVGEL